MSNLRLFDPPHLSVIAGPHLAPSAPSNGDPVILRFPGSRLRSSPEPGVDRARKVRQNRFCPHCGKASVRLICDEPALLSRSEMPIPGAGEILGFRCDRCEHEWE